MMESMRWIAGFLLVAILGAGGLFIAAGRAAPPTITITQPGAVIGPKAVAGVSAAAPGANFSALTITVEQNGRRFPVFTLDRSRTADPAAAAGQVVTQIDGDSLQISQPFGTDTLPELQSGSARLIVEASRPSILNLRTLSSSATHEFRVRLEPPKIAVLSTHHYINHGGSELVVYRVTPDDVASGVRVGTTEYPGFPLGGGDTALRVAYFALLHDQDLDTPIVAFARDEAGAQATATFINEVFPKAFKQSRIELDDRFIGRVVPEIIDNSPELKMTVPADPADTIAAYLTLNGDVRRRNAEQIAAFAAQTSPTRLWEGAFVQLGNSAVEAAFADRRTYFYQGKEVDRQVHLGFDLAATAAVPVAAANAGRVLHAGRLGIYGNCVILDHGQGVQSLYGHLSSFDVKVGDAVTRGQSLGRSGMTGLAGGDHLHFTMLVGGQMVNPVEWWDPHWIADRVERKLTEAGLAVPSR
jgi:murein DD-endopeptidase MepM/ murein hydrolase activator NlpD